MEFRNGSRCGREEEGHFQNNKASPLVGVGRVAPSKRGWGGRVEKSRVG